MEHQLQMSGEVPLITDSDLSSVGETFKLVVSQMKNTLPYWEELIQRGIKFQRQLEATIVAFNFFSDSFGKVADIAVRSKGATRDLGTQLTTLVMWHKQLELKLRGLNQALATNFLSSMQGNIEEFRKSAGTLEKECDRELKKSVTEAKGACSKTVKTSKSLEKKTKKEKFDEAHALKTELSKKQQEASLRVQAVYNMEKRHLTKLFTEERIWYCSLVRDYQGVMNIGVSMIGDLQRLQDISQELSITTHHSQVLPEKTIDYIAEMCPLASSHSQLNDFQESLVVDSQRRGSATPQPQRSTTAGLARRSQSFDTLDDPSIYSEIASFNSSYSVSPLTGSYSAAQRPPSMHSSTPPPHIGYNSAPPPPPPPIHKAAQFNAPHKEVEVHPEDQSPSPPAALTENVSPSNVSPSHPSRYSGIDWHADLKEKLRKRAESVGNCIVKRPDTPPVESNNRPETPLDDQMYVDVVAPAYSMAQNRSLSMSSPPLNQGKFSMTPPGTPPMKRSEHHVPPKRPPKPMTKSVSSYHGNDDDDDTANDSSFAQALKHAKLKKVVSSNDRSAPRV